MPRRQRSAWGTVDEVRRGQTYRLRYMAYDSEGNYRRVCETLHCRASDAWAALAQRCVEHRAESGATVRDAYERQWVPWADRRCETGEMRPNSRKAFDSAWRTHVGPRWGNVGMDAVRPADVETWMQGKSRATALLCRSLLRRIFDRARFAGMTAADPFSSRIEVPTGKGAGRGSVTYDTRQLLELWDALRGDVSEAPFLLMAFGSCRVGESLGVRAVDTTFGVAENGVPALTFPVAAQVTADGLDGTLKTEESRRVCVLVGPMAERVRDVAAQTVADGLTWLADDGFGSPISQWTLRKCLERGMDAAGLPRAQARSLRRSWETVANWTLELDEVKREMLMGHAVPTVTGRHYDKPTTADFVRALTKAYESHPFAER